MIPYTPEELELVLQLSIPGGWDSKDAKGIKKKIKPQLLAKTSNCCCYCLLSMHGWHGLTIDIEHVLPKAAGKFPQFMFDQRNLSVSCKRCNMGIKRDDTSFYSGGLAVDPFHSNYYSFIHPTLDTSTEHLSIELNQIDDKLMIKYLVRNDSAKGASAYEYFKLERLEINSFDQAQGVEIASAIESLPSDIADEVQDLVNILESGPN